jgi:non-ribosomal peptide synthetase component F
MLPPEERQKLLFDWNQTEAEYPQTLCVHELFEAQVERDPNAQAVVYEDQSLSYGELNARANKLAHQLRAMGAKPDSRIAICVERSLEMVIGLLAILKAGAAYVPLDPAYPSERLSHMLKDSDPVIVLTHPATREALQQALNKAAITSPVLDIDSDQNDWIVHPQTNLNTKNIGLTSQNLAYVIYTSGSTGAPKGVMIEHKGVVNRLSWMQEKYEIGDKDRVLQKTPFGFDVSVWEFFWTLSAGARLVLL